MASTPYTSWIGHGATCPTPPVTFSNVHANAFGVEASRQAIQALVDALLTPATEGMVEYRCPVGAALITFNDVEHSASKVDQIGWMPAREAAIWVLLIEERKAPFPGIRPVLWAPYIFIDIDLGLVSGREIWGWPKAIARVAVATDTPSAPARFAVQTNIFRTFDPNLRGEVANLISVTGTRPLPVGNPTWQTGTEVMSALVGQFLNDLDEGLSDLDKGLLRLLHLEPILPAIALKQFRETIDPMTVCFRALVNAPCRFTGFRGGQPLNDDFTVTIETCASHAIVKDLLGKEPQAGSTGIPVKWAAMLNFDFDAENGSTIVPP
jgi:hypothetical protein